MNNYSNLSMDEPVIHRCLQYSFLRLLCCCLGCEYFVRSYCCCCEPINKPHVDNLAIKK